MKTHTVLIVDDEPMARDIMEGFLFQEGYELVFASSGLEALSILEAVNPDLILLDVMMPDLNGFEICQRLKADKTWRHVPIILVTALGQQADLARGFEAGADDFLRKPVDDIELRARVRGMLRIKKQHDELQANLHLREDLAHMIVHDMRTPVSAILGYCELLQMKGAAAFLKEIEKIRQQALSLNSFLNDILVMAKMEADRLILHPSQVELKEFIQQAVQNHQVIAEIKRINLVIDLPEESRPARLDSNLFQRVLDNLLANAIKFSPYEGSVILRLEYPAVPQPAGEDTAGLQFRLTVLDEGPGVPEEYRDRIFDKFEIVTLAQNESATYQAGLGLAFCKLVVEAHNGSISVEDNQPNGSAFIVEI